MAPMIEFLSFGVLAGIPIGAIFFAIARRKKRKARAWGLSMWILAALWLAGAAALPSMSGTEPQKAAAMPVVFVTAGSFLTQAVLFLSLILSGRPGTVDEAATKKRIAILLGILLVILLITVIAVLV